MGLQGISDIFHQHAEEFIEDEHDELGTKFVIQSTEKKDFVKQHMQTDQSHAECRQEHDDVSCENTKNMANQTAECKGVVCEDEMYPQHERLIEEGVDQNQSCLAVSHSRNSVNAEGAHHGTHSAVVGCFVRLIAHLRGRISCVCLMHRADFCRLSFPKKLNLMGFFSFQASPFHFFMWCSYKTTTS